MENKIVYKYEDSDELFSELFYKLINKLYSFSYPKPSVDFETMGKLSPYLSKGKYKYPIDFYYLPNDVYKEILDDFMEKHRIEFHWKSDIDFLIKILFNDGGIKEVYSTDEYNDKPYRHCIDVETLDKYIPKEYSDKVKEIIDGYANTYKFGSRDYNSMLFTTTNFSPNTSRETVIEAWKEIFNKDIEIPDDSYWVDEYKAVDDEYEEEAEV